MVSPVSSLSSVITVKIYNPKTRVIVQMLKPSSKVILLPDSLVCVCVCVYEGVKCSCPCVFQVLVQKIPDWDWTSGDAALCPMELKLGFMAQSCRLPGLSSLLANLFTMQSEVEVRSPHGYTRTHTHGPKIHSSAVHPAHTHNLKALCVCDLQQKGNSWKNLYREGMYNEIYTEHLSYPFRGMTFAQASK